MSLHLHEAAHSLLETGHAPTPVSLGVSESRYDYPDQQALMDEAVRLFSCGLRGGCGPRSWLLLNYCIVAGCSPNTTLQGAYRENLSPSAYHLMQGYYLWLHRQRRAGDGG